MNIPPLDPAGAKGEHFHSLVDNAARPSVFVIQDNTRAFPGTLNPKGVSYHTTSLVRRIIIMRSASSRSVPRVARALSPVAQGISSPTRTPAPGRSRAPRRRPRRRIIIRGPRGARRGPRGARRGPRGAHARRASPRPSRSWRTRPPAVVGPSPAAHRGVARESGSARPMMILPAASMKWWSSPTTTRRRRARGAASSEFGDSSPAAFTSCSRLDRVFCFRIKTLERSQTGPNPCSCQCPIGSYP